MKAFPAEFEGLLNKRGLRILDRGAAGFRRGRSTESMPTLEVVAGLINEDVAERCHALLDASLLAHVRLLAAPIPRESTSGMTRNYSECLHKVVRQRTVYLDSRRSQAYRQAKEIGLVSMLKSESLARFAEAMTGLKLERKNGVQAILYEHGDYVGPHNDHHPEELHLRNGYIDVHLSFTNDAVASQLIICEGPDGHLNMCFDATRNGTISVHRLPFWHHATPLQAKRSREREARRWLLLASYWIKP